MKKKDVGLPRAEKKESGNKGKKETKPKFLAISYCCISGFWFIMSVPPHPLLYFKAVK